MCAIYSYSLSGLTFTENLFKVSNTHFKNHISGVKNLIDTCMQVMPGDRVLMVLEPADQAFYDPAVGALIEKELTRAGAKVSVLRPEIVSNPIALPEHVSVAMGQSEHTLFLSRLGDYARFTPMTGNSAVAICYARQLSMLDSPFSGVSHNLMSRLLQKLEDELLQARHWRITCELGTDLQGSFCWPSHEGGIDDDFSMTLFPVMTFKPVPCNTTSGNAALSRWLMPVAAAKVDPAVVSFDGIVNARVEDGQITGLSGNDKAVQQVTDYYNLVSSTLGTERNRIHSWHVGINPFTAYTGNADVNLEDWGAISFASPRYLHFHTCGDVPPGEIAWSIFNPTVFVDGQCFWESGQFCWLQREDNIALINETVGAQCLLGESADIGI